ncbi:hypothetical protein RRF05_14135, partial [Staphylococcus aureus]|nr:hypothetical protein [Staphylococcus aureus]
HFLPKDITFSIEAYNVTFKSSSNIEVWQALALLATNVVARLLVGEIPQTPYDFFLTKKITITT